MKGLYDVDCVTWSPQGKLFQVDYAKEAVKHGGLTLGIRSNTHAVDSHKPGVVHHQAKPYTAGHVPRQDLQGRQQHGHVYIRSDLRRQYRARLTAGVIYKYMKRETNAHINLFDVPIVPGKLIGKVASKFQSKTFSYGGRPYGVGLLIAFWDGEKAKLHEITPAGDQFEYYV